MITASSLPLLAKKSSSSSFSATDAVFDGNTSVNFTVVLPPVFFVFMSFADGCCFAGTLTFVFVLLLCCKTSSHSSQVDREEDFVG